MKVDCQKVTGKTINKPHVHFMTFYGNKLDVKTSLSAKLK